MMNASELLKENGLRKSAQRMAVITILQRHACPLTEEEIKGEMDGLYDRVTFYRTMQALAGAGIVHRIVVDNTAVRYALNAGGYDKAHVHFFCKECHSVICLKDIPVRHYPLSADFIQEDCEVLIKGICPDCARKMHRPK